MEIPDDYRERIFKWIDGLKPGFRQKIDHSKPKSQVFIAVVKEAIDEDPMSGLEFTAGYEELRYQNLDFTQKPIFQNKFYTKK